MKPTGKFNSTQEKQIIRIATEINRLLNEEIEIHPNSPIHNKLNESLQQFYKDKKNGKN
jgi:hypothetical protein